MTSAPSSEAVALQILEIPHDIDLVGQAGPAASGTNRLDETARFLESRIESYNVHAHSTRLHVLCCSEVSKGWYSEVI